MNKEGCRTWEQDGKKYMCFWDTVLERYTTCINPMITYRRAVKLNLELFNIIFVESPTGLSIILALGIGAIILYPIDK